MWIAFVLSLWEIVCSQCTTEIIKTAIRICRHGLCSFIQHKFIEIYYIPCTSISNALSQVIKQPSLHESCSFQFILEGWLGKKSCLLLVLLKNTRPLVFHIWYYYLWTINYEYANCLGGVILHKHININNYIWGKCLKTKKLYTWIYEYICEWQLG